MAASRAIAPVVFANGLVADRRADLPDPAQVDFCRAWIRLFATKLRSINTRHSSYGHKHRVEAWSETLGTDWSQVDPSGRAFVSRRFYASNGSFIMAALAEGYRIRQIGNG